MTGACGDGAGHEPVLALLPGPPEWVDVVIVISPLEAASLVTKEKLSDIGFSADYYEKSYCNELKLVRYRFRKK